MAKQFFYVLILSVILSSCDHQSQNTKKIIYRTNYVVDKGWINIDTIIYSININDDLITHIYQLRSDTLEIFNFFSNDTTRMIFDGDTCPLIGYKEFSINDTIYKVRKYEYDIEHSCDEESSVFYVVDYGIISIKSEAWLVMDFYDVANTDLLGLLKRDATGFFWKNIPPPPIDDASIKQIK